MRLTVLERINILGILPSEGNFVTLKIVRDLRGNLSFSEEEIKRLNIQQQDAQISWNSAAEDPEGAEVPIGEKATDVIVEALRKLDREAKLTEPLLSVWEKFL